ncbi:hypothetical protein DFO61_1033 [Ectopseudomonas oleovorans]|uniref:Uncharacterized protein n=2 Tax=Pseudomonadaceae TaxID=135621 RepID=A0A397NMU0_ECTOL|nr:MULTISPECIES: hypothetical protein [Pseudomonas]QMV65339.1 hypothetical protein HS968_09870 [Pseudomonas berkeleyensis]RIA36557.1 hypothetical protein DFO61_1033 [Pseudomonas oleovorans]WSO40819.1 hypothetical protein VUJ49_09905 [Pseudomonas berkeleyensis]
MSDIDYPYSQGDRLEERNTYFYSQYHGAAFFPAWRASRQAALMQLPPAQAVPLPVAAERNAHHVDTAALLADLLHAAADAPSKRRLAERLLQRFEVSKRLHRRYDANYKAVADSGYDDLELYLQFAALCLHLSEQPGALPFLNGLLKVIDSLISILPRLSPAQGAQLAWLIAAEQDWVARIASQANVELAP